MHPALFELYSVVRLDAEEIGGMLVGTGDGAGGRQMF